MSDKINIDLTYVFRRSVMKLANTYKPNFDSNTKSFANEQEMIENYSSLICEDFSDQLKPILIEEFNQAFFESLESDN